MTDQITPELFKHLVQLGAMELMPEEAEYIRHQLNNQLKAINELAAIPLDDSTPPAAHGVPFTPEMRPALRQDVWMPEPDPQKILAQAPQLAENYIVVPEIPHTDL